jgi:soluble lytic murein transglycosylase-like protein
MRRLLTQIIVLSVGAFALVGFGGVSAMLSSRAPSDAGVSADSSDLTAIRTQLADTKRELERAHQILEYSGRYAIPADLSAQIYDIAVAEGISPAVGFQLVKVESDFQNTALSTAAATGLTQIRLATARSYDAKVNASDLMNADVSLHLGFRYLKDLMDRFDHNVPLALEAYNKGPTFVSAEQDQGRDVMGKYSKAVMGGVKKRG